MKEKQKKFVINKDIVLILVLLLIALAFWGARRFAARTSQSPGGTGPYAQVIYGGDVVREVYLEEDQTFSIPEVPQVEFQIKDHEICFLHSDCPDQVCVYTGSLKQDGEFAACLPNNVMLWIVEDEEA